MQEINLKEIFRKVLISNGISEEIFSMDGYKENAICIEKTSKGYLVYKVCNKIKNDEVRCEELLKAYYVVILRLPCDKSKIMEIKKIFTDKVIDKTLEEQGIKD